ncbi:uncharacterized protein LOC109134407 [Beta vulgaris subsp. vulgaris]|uniref:uncharacterized protein LOC109134407 n=1 Tax=Beta vulgaris subsp. vulgaris TaxID=3555 RepID=UPI0009013C64|nr:uncharacterized protein LOC109134407 [Beta vulgaris subsp. vulgaris]
MENALKIIDDAEKLDRFDGTNFTLWKEKMKFFLIALNIFYILDDDLKQLPETSDKDTEQIVVDCKKRKDDKLLCCGYILNNQSDCLYDLYTRVQYAKEIWKALEAKYATEKQGVNNKFLTMKFFEFTMLDNVSVLDQVHKFMVLASKFKDLAINILEKLLMGAIIAKLPSNWNDYRKRLLHTYEDFNLEQIYRHLRIEEETRIRNKSYNEASSSKINHVSDSQKGKRGQKRKGNHTHNNPNNNKNGKKNWPDLVCYNCGDKGHIK